MDPELLRILVPLGIFAFWAITKLSERGVKPLEPRGPNLPQPRAQDSLEALLRRQNAEAAERQRQQPPMRWSNQSNASHRDDDIVILSETRSSKPAPRRAGRTRGGAQAKLQAQSQPNRALKPALGGDISQTVAQNINESLALKPMTLSGMNISTSTQQAAARVNHGENDHILGVREALMDPKRIREAIVLNEILRPPVSRRRGRRI